MKLFSKIFAVLMIILSISLSMTGYLLISGSFERALEREKEQAIEQFQITQALTEAKIESSDNTKLEELFGALMPSKLNGGEERTMTAFFSPELEVLYSDFPNNFSYSMLNKTKDNQLICEITKVNDKYICVITGTFQCGNLKYYMVTGHDITSVMKQYGEMEERYKLIYLIICSIATVSVLLVTLWIVIPIKKLNRSAIAISNGNYKIRIGKLPNDEVGELGKSFNSMANAVSDSVEELKTNAVQKEDFVANFAHELKTPLTSVIGYADMLCQRDLNQSQVREAAGYILSEGMRLEDLSLKLMELIVLNRQEFQLEECATKELRDNLEETLKPAVDKKNIILEIKFEDAWIKIDYSLFKTLILNLADNSIKADAKKIDITGKRVGQNYSISVSDNGRGIPGKDLSRVTEAFYMVDKSRSRKQHGAGIGLALVSRIAQVHHAELSIESVENKGTTVEVRLPMEGGLPQ